MKRFLFLLAIGFQSSLIAHQFSTAQLSLQQMDDNQHVGYLAYSLADLESAIGLDKNQDGTLLWQEVKQSYPLVTAYVESKTQFAAHSSTENNSTANNNLTNNACQIVWHNEPRLMSAYGEALLQLPLKVACANSHTVTLNYAAFTSELNQHKLLINWRTDDQLHQGLLDKDTFNFVVKSNTATGWDNFWLFLKQGVIHIGIGIDHILFIIALILPIAGYSRKNDATSNNAKTVFQQLIWVITWFTLAHSVTLTLTALGLIQLPAKLIESGIALSVIFAAINVVTGWIKRMGWLTFLFGLLHGMGFAGALTELGIPQQFQLASVLAFNLGVEVGQLIILAFCFPFLWWLRTRQGVRDYLVPASVFGVVVMGSFWLLQRMEVIA